MFDMATYDPKTNKFPYPEYTDRHYLEVKKNDGTVFDKNYPYIDRSKGFLFKQWCTRILLRLIVFPLDYIRLGLKVEGKKNLKKHKEEIKKGCLSVCNHVHMWDYISIMNAIKPFKPYILAWDKNISGEMGGMIRSVGGIPIPQNDYSATIAYLNAVEGMIKKGGWLHIYPEGSMWEYYQPIRPFKNGTSFIAVDTNRPIIPLAFSYRKPGWIRTKIFKQIALFTLHIGEPLYPNEDLPKREREIELTERCHDAVCSLAGIDPEKNIYPKIFNKSKRIDYYTDTYGVGYTGSK